MLIWIALFLVVLVISFILAFQSMGSYYERAANFSTEYSLFLIGKPEDLSVKLLGELHDASLKNNLIISFERLFRGQRRALVVFGPTFILRPFSDILGLSELEDYSRKVDADKGVIPAGLLTWEVGIKSSASPSLVIKSLKSYIPPLEENEEFWWQLVIQPAGRHGIMSFQAIIRAVLISTDLKRARDLQKDLLEIGGDVGLTQLPQAHSTQHMLKFYQDRALPQTSLAKFKERGLSLSLSPEEILSLAGILSPSA